MAVKREFNVKIDWSKISVNTFKVEAYTEKQAVVIAAIKAGKYVREKMEVF